MFQSWDAGILKKGMTTDLRWATLGSGPHHTQKENDSEIGKGPKQLEQSLVFSNLAVEQKWLYPF